MDDAQALPPTVQAAEAPSLDRLLTLKDGDLFLVADAWGDLTGGADGLFERDTRILSRLVLLIGAQRPSRLGSAVSDDNVFFTCQATNRPLPPIGGRSAPGGVIHLERRRFLWGRRLYERIRLTNYEVRETTVPLTLEYAADFRDIFEVRGTSRPSRGRSIEPVVGEASIVFGYDGLDHVRRATTMIFSEPPQAISRDRATFLLSLQPGERRDLFLEAGETVVGTPGRERWRLAAVRARLAMRARRRRGATLRGRRSPRFNQWLDQSRADLALLTTDLPTGAYPYAGIPWFSTPFGRDALIAAWQLLWLDPSLAAGVLSYLGSRQATAFDAFQDAAPGKIMHETRGGEMAALGEVPFALYYGGVDTTCLFVALAGAYARRTGDLDLIRRIWPNLQAAAAWMAGPGDSNGDGLIDYARAEDTGLSNQGWKDSEDSVFHSDGRFPAGPVALLEVQGYAFAAWRAMADMSTLLGKEGAADYSGRADRVQALVEELFWMEDEGFYAMAMDGEGKPCRILGSNAGHLLFTGLPSAERARRVTDRLLSARFRTGWGLRTLASDQARYNPMSYHNGSVWPHDTALCVAGMARYGERDAVSLVLDELYEAAAHFEMRLPELFCGFNRTGGEPPIPYPVACMPQAWAAGSVFLLIQASLGVNVDAIDGVVTVDRPCLPSGLEHLTVHGLGAGRGRLTLEFEQAGSGVLATARQSEGAPLRLNLLHQAT